MDSTAVRRAVFQHHGQLHQQLKLRPAISVVISITSLNADFCATDTVRGRQIHVFTSVNCIDLRRCNVKISNML